LFRTGKDDYLIYIVCTNTEINGVVMAFLASVKKALGQWNIHHTTSDDTTGDPTMIMDSATPAPGSLAKVIFLKDVHGRVQVLIPSNRLLDLNQLAHQLGRQFTALSPDELQALKQKLGLDDSPALPQLTQIESLIDHSLLELDELYIQSSTTNTCLRLPADQFRALTTRSHIGHYSAPIQTDLYHATTAEDTNDINAAVRQFTPLRIQQRLQDTLDLPPLPETARRIIELRIDPNADTVSLAQAVELDPSMSAQILSWARSPYYRSRGNITTVEEAVLRVLGFDLVMNLALGLALGRSLDVPREGPKGYTPFWQQAVLGAALASDLARRCKLKNRPDSGLAYLCGLLHNFGFLVLAHVFPPQFSLINRHIEANPHINRCYIERHLLALTREQIAASLLQQWDLPEEVVVALRQQHNPHYDGEHAVYARILNVTTRSLRAHGYGDGPQEALDPDTLSALGLSDNAAGEATEELVSHVGELSDLVQALSA
tara:strand:+ start:1006 stop:2472 length:1467 start_codon:yes stop_codon:yes gene_type:complete